MNQKVHSEVLRRFGRDPKEIFERDGWKCLMCGSTEDLTIDHIDGNGRGSKKPNNEITNLQTLCRTCHSRKDYFRVHPGGSTKVERVCQYCNAQFKAFAYFLKLKNRALYCSRSCAGYASHQNSRTLQRKVVNTQKYYE